LWGGGLVEYAPTVCNIMFMADRSLSLKNKKNRPDNFYVNYIFPRAKDAVRIYVERRFIYK
jgi:hypothetical protein